MHAMSPWKAKVSDEAKCNMEEALLWDEHENRKHAEH